MAELQGEQLNVFEVILVGMRFNNVDVEKATEYLEYHLQPEPDNKYDKNAIQVFGIDRKGKHLLGHVSRNSQKQVPDLRGQCRTFPCYSAYTETANAINLRLFKD